MSVYRLALSGQKVIIQMVMKDAGDLAIRQWNFSFLHPVSTECLLDGARMKIVKKVDRGVKYHEGIVVVVTVANGTLCFHAEGRPEA